REHRRRPRRGALRPAAHRARRLRHPGADPRPLRSAPRCRRRCAGDRGRGRRRAPVGAAPQRPRVRRGPRPPRGGRGCPEVAARRDVRRARAAGRRARDPHLRGRPCRGRQPPSLALRARDRAGLRRSAARAGARRGRRAGAWRARPRRHDQRRARHRHRQAWLARPRALPRLPRPPARSEIRLRPPEPPQPWEGTMTTTTRLDPTALLSDLAAREDLSRGFGPRHSHGPDALPLLGGAPSPDLLPLAQISAASQALAADPTALVGALPYSQPAGREALRAWIARREGVDASRVLVTNGAFHGLSLVFDALLDRGDEIIVEDPTYPLIFRDLQHH